MNNPIEVVAFYLQRIKNTSHAVEKRIIQDDLFLYYYRLTDSEQEAVHLLMQPLLNQKRTEMEASDPLLKRAGDLLRRLESKHTTSM